MKNKKILLADYVLDFLKEKNVKHVPLLIGGAISFMVDSFSKKKRLNIDQLLMNNLQQ